MTKTPIQIAADKTEEALRVLATFSALRGTARSLEAAREAIDKAEDLLRAARGAFLEESQFPQEHVEDVQHGERRVEHDAFGVIQVSRVSGFQKLFGSELRSHQHFIRIRVARAEARFDSRGQMEPWGKWGRYGTLVEFDLSAAQFAEAITTMNVARGVPCTLRSVCGRDIERVPEDIESNATKILESFQEQMESAPEVGRELAQQIKGLLDKSGLSAKKQAEILPLVHRLAMSHQGDAEFTLERFHEAAEKTLASAKAEADAVLTMITHNLGLQRLAEVQENARLTAGNEED